jgi:hypothetical protein
MRTRFYSRAAVAIYLCTIVILAVAVGSRLWRTSSGDAHGILEKVRSHHENDGVSGNPQEAQLTSIGDDSMLSRVEVSIVYSSSDVPVKCDSVSWCSDDQQKGGVVHEVQWLEWSEALEKFVGQIAPGTIEFTAKSHGLGVVSGTHQVVNSPVSVELVVPELYVMEIELVSDGRRVAWPQQLSSPRITPVTTLGKVSNWSVSDGILRALLTNAGTYTVDIPAIEGYRRHRPQEIHVLPNTISRVTVVLSWL